MDQLLDTLFHKRGSEREAALSSLTDGFTGNYRHQFAEKNFATVLYRCLNSFKKGSSKERCLAARVLGLLAITRGCGDNAHELYEESLLPLSQALKPGSESVTLTSVLDCLAIVTFVGANDTEETEKSMQCIWKFIHSESEPKVTATKHLAAVQTSAISAWSFLLTSTDNWTLNYTHWLGAISFFMELLEANDESVRVAADEALTLIFEGGCLEKFASDTKGTSDNSICKRYNSLNGFSSLKELKENVLIHAQNIAQKSKGETSVNKTMDADCNSKWKFMKILADGCYAETSTKIGKQNLKLYTWSQFLQVKFLKHFLANGFVRHMLENEFLHDVFNFTPKTQLGNKLYVSEREEVTVRFFVPEARRKDCKERIFKSHNSVFRKARTQLLNKQRDIRGKELSPLCD